MTGADAEATGALEMRGAVVHRGVRRIAADLRVALGEVVVLAGANGTGKTTVLHAVAGLLPLTSGEVRLAGRTLDGADAWVPPERRGIGLVPQQHEVFAHLSALENVAYGLRARGQHRRDARAQAQRWLDRLGVGDIAEARAGRLSGGQAQRVAIARALCARPRAVLLDEPFAAIDAASRPHVREVVRAALEELGVPAILVTHDAAADGAIADRVVELAAGPPVTG
ncbi:ABC transporter ATP-binding protein [Miniimonas sp. S16]|uniref:ABC transporter ATP-binding protein n=1 Tax=Miniimonas sp. S16 TaxID=2171623 RepID=UPI000D529D68|nr:ATP-binding cassette domain-containing protein [Miniimonas sp. S16]